MLKNGLKDIFFSHTSLENLTKELDETKKREIIARNILKFLLYGERNNLRAGFQTITHPILLKGVLWKKDLALLYAVRQETKKIFQHIHHKLAKTKLTKALHKKLHYSIANLLSYYVLFEPTPFDGVIKIPRKIKNQYVLVDYKIEAIELTPQSPISTDEERVFAYGLTPHKNKNANRILVFCGTTLPTGQGLSTQQYMNMHPYSSVGEIYDWENVKQWLDSKSDNIGVDVCGASQGGGLSLLLAMMRPENIRRVDALNPPGMLHDYDETHPSLGAWEQAKKEGKSLPKVMIQSQVGDPLTKVGLWKPEWKIISVDSKDKWISRIPILRNYIAHVINFSGFSNSQIKKLNAANLNTFARYLTTQIVMKGARRIGMYFFLILNIPTFIINQAKSLLGFELDIDRTKTCKIHRKKHHLHAKSSFVAPSKNILNQFHQAKNEKATSKNVPSSRTKMSTRKRAL